MFNKHAVKIHHKYYTILIKIMAHLLAMTPRREFYLRDPVFV